MAIDLVAKLRLQDDFTGPMQKAMKKMDAASKSADKLDRATKKSTNSFKGFGGGIKSVFGGLGSLVSKLNPVATGIAAIGTAAAGAYASMKIFNATVGEAMKMQQSQVIIGAMFNDEKLSKQYMKMMDELAISSPMLDSQAMYGNSKSYVALSKDTKQLKEMWKITERLMASDPAQGVDGAVFALRELFSGDAISIVERFEMSRDVMNEIKKLPIDQQLKRLDQYFNKLGFTDKLIADMGGTALGKWTQAKERWQLIMREMGEKSLGTVGDFLNKTLDRLEGAPMQKFAEWGGKIISQIVSGVSNGAVKLYDYLTTITSSDEFKKRTTITGKVDFIVSDIADKLKKWYDEQGAEKLTKFASGVVELLVGVLDNSAAFFELGTRLGDSVSQGILQGIKNAAIESQVGQFLKVGLMGGDNYDKAMDKINAGYAARKTDNEKSRKSHYHGIDYVPTNQYPASLHKGEAVLPAQEAKTYREGKGGGSSVTVTGNTFVVREDSDIEQIAYKLAKYIEREALQIG